MTVSSMLPSLVPLPTRPLPAPATTESAPETIIERRPGWHWLGVAELWRFRELLFFLIWRDVKIRYKQTVLGAAWAVLQPVATMAVFTLFLGRLAQGADTDVPYALFVFAGLLPWTFLANAIGTGGHSLVANQNLVTKVHFPRLMIPMGAVGAGLVDFAVAFGMLFVMMAIWGVAPGWSVFLLPVTILGLILLALGTGILLSALTVAYRDFRFVIPFLVQFWMFSTPSIYVQTESALGPRWAWLLPLNPAHGLIANFRLAALGGTPDLYSLSVSGAVSVVLFFGGCLYFRRVERTFADII